MSIIKKGITVWAFENGVTGQYDYREIMKKVKEAGFDALELSFYEKGTLSLESSIEDLLDIRKAADETGILLSSMSTLLLNDVNLTSVDDSECKKAYTIVESMIRAASVMNIPTVSISPGKVTPEVNYKIAYNKAKEAIRHLAECAEKSKVKLCLENVWQNFLLSPLEFYEFVLGINSESVGICLDIGNTLLLGYPQHWIDIMADKIYKMHFDDFRKRRGLFWEYTDLGKGEVDWKNVMAHIHRIRYDGYATVEAFYKNSEDEMQQLKNISEQLDMIIGLS